MRVDRKQIHPEVLKEQQKLSEQELEICLDEFSKQSAYLSLADLEDAIYETENSELPGLNKKVRQKIAIAFFCVLNKYNKNLVIPDNILNATLRKEYEKWVQDLSQIKTHIIALKQADKRFVPVRFETIFYYLDKYIGHNIYVLIINSLGVDNIPRQDDPAVLIRVFEDFKRTLRRKKNELALEYYSVFLTQFVSEDQFNEHFKHLTQNKIEKFIIPEMFEDCFFEFEEIKDRKKIEIIYPLFLAVSPDLKKKSEEGGILKKKLMDSLYDKVYRSSR